jgi:hypothetical protein
MKNTIIKTLTILSLVTVSSVSFAEKTFSYDLVEAGAIRFNIKPAGRTFNYDGYFVSGAKEVSDNVHIFASYADTDNASMNLNLKTFGAGLHHSISEDTDVVFDLSRVNYSLSNDNLDLATSGNFNAAELGLRHRLSDDLEITTSFTKWAMDATPISYSGLGIGAIKKINNDVSVRFDYKNLKISQGQEDVNPITLSIRHYY